MLACLVQAGLKADGEEEGDGASATELLNLFDQVLSLLASEGTIEAEHVWLIVIAELNGIGRKGTPGQQLAHINTCRFQLEEKASDVMAMGRWQSEGDQPGLEQLFDALLHGPAPTGFLHIGIQQTAGHRQVSFGDPQQTRGFRRGHGAEHLP